MVLVQHIANLVIKIFTELPKDLQACGGLYSEVAETIEFVVKHINPATLLTNVVANLFTHLLQIVGDAWNLFIAVFQMNFYEMGRLTGELFILTVN